MKRTIMLFFILIASCSNPEKDSIDYKNLILTEDLASKLISLSINCVDKKYGGFNFCLDRKGTVIDTDKGINHAAVEAVTNHIVMMINVLKSSVRAYERNFSINFYFNIHKDFLITQKL